MGSPERFFLGFSATMTFVCWLLCRWDDESLTNRLEREGGNISAHRSVVTHYCLPSTPLWTLNLNCFINMVAVALLYFGPVDDPRVLLPTLFALIMTTVKIEGQSMALLTQYLLN